MAMTFGLNPGAYVSVTAPTIITLTPLAPGETFPPSLTVIPQAVAPVTVPTTAAEPAPAAGHKPWEVIFTEKP